MSPYKMEALRIKLLENRPHLKEESLRSYLGSYRRVFKNVAQVGDTISESFFWKNSKKIIAYLRTTPLNSAKTILSALTVLTLKHPSCEDFRTEMNRLAEKQLSQKKLQLARPNEIIVPWKQLQGQYHRLWTDFSPIFKFDDLKLPEFLVLRDLVLAACFMLIPPRRIKDYTDLKLRNVDKEKDNYLVCGQTPALVFNSYKTAKFYGSQKVELPSNLFHILKKWSEFNPYEYMFNNGDNQPLKQPEITRILNKIFGVGVSVNVLRHSYITEYLKNTPKLADMERLASDMGHSVAEQQLYRRV
jgi:hypothetical protein